VVIFSAIVFTMGSVAPATGQPQEPATTEHSQPKVRKPQLPPSPAVRKVIPNEVVIKVTEQYLSSRDHIEGRNKALTDVAEALRKQFGAESIIANPKRRVLLMRLPPGVTHENVRKTLLNDTRIDYVMPNYELTPHGHTLPPPTTDWLWKTHPPPGELPSPFPSDSSYLWGLEKIGMKQAWGLLDNNWSQVVVAILDRSVDSGHLDLVDSYTGGVSYCGSLPTGFDMEHGTSVAGILGARGDNGSLSTDNTKFFVGVNKVANFKAVTIACPLLDITRATWGIDYAVQQNARVINMSWGLYGWDEMNQLVVEFKQAIMAGTNTLFVSSAGNEVRDYGCPQPPLPTVFPQMFHLDNLIVVAATNPSDTLWVDQPPIGNPCLPENRADNPNRPVGVPLVHGSNFGSTVVDIGAPGEGIFSVLPRLQFQPSEGPFWGYVSFTSGTSNSAPLVAGCAALIQTRRLGLGLPVFSPHELKTFLMNTGDALPVAEAGKVASGKRLNCHSALQQIQGNGPPSAPANLSVH
jgi:hypothetical protein